MRAFILSCVLAYPATAAAPPALDEPQPAGEFLRLGGGKVEHPARLRSLALSPDGRVLATADEKDEVRIWDARAGRLVHTLAKAGTAVALSPDGRTLATADGTGFLRQPVRLWDLATGKMIRAIKVLPGKAVAFSPDGIMLAGGDGGKAVVCDARTCRVLHRLGGLDGEVSAVAFSRDGKWLAAGDAVGKGVATVIVWGLPGGKERCRVADEDGGGIRSVTLSFDGARVATATPYAAHLWDARTGRRIGDLRGASGAVAFDLAGRLLAGGAGVRILAPEGRKSIRTFGKKGEFTDLLAVSDGGLVASNATHDREARLWDADTGTSTLLKVAHRGPVEAIAWSPDGRRLATFGTGGVIVWDARNGGPLRALPVGDTKRYRPGQSSLAFSADGRSLGMAGSRWDIATGKEAVKLKKEIWLHARSRDGKFAAVEDGEGVRILDENGRVLHDLDPPFGKIPRFRDASALAFTPDSRLLAIGKESDEIGGASIHLYAVKSGKLLRGLLQTDVAPDRLVFSPDGAMLAAWGRRFRAAVLDVATGERLPLDAGFGPLAFSVDGTLFAAYASGGKVQLLETATGKPVRVFAEPRSVESLAFSPDGARLASGDDDGDVVVRGVLPDPTEGRLWESLAKEPEKAYRALSALVRDPAAGVRLLARNLYADEVVDAKRIERLVTDLGAGEIKTRQAAAEQLSGLGRVAEHAMRRALAGMPNPEQLKGCIRLLSKMPDLHPDELRDLRAIQALERIGTPAAVALLKRIANGGEGGVRTLAARAALARLKPKRP